MVIWKSMNKRIAFHIFTLKLTVHTHTCNYFYSTVIAFKTYLAFVETKFMHGLMKKKY